MKNTPSATSPKSMRISLLSLLLVGLSCSLLPGGSDVEKSPGDATAGLASTALETAPAVIDSVTGLISTVALSLILLSLAFRRSRQAIAGMLTALAEAITYRINNWKIKKTPVEPADGPE